MTNFRRFVVLIFAASWVLLRPLNARSGTNLLDFLGATRLSPTQLQLLLRIEGLPDNVLRTDGTTFHEMVANHLAGSRQSRRNLTDLDALELLRVQAEQDLARAPILKAASAAAIELRDYRDRLLPQLASEADLARITAQHALAGFSQIVSTNRELLLARLFDPKKLQEEAVKLRYDPTALGKRISGDFESFLNKADDRRAAFQQLTESERKELLAKAQTFVRKSAFDITNLIANAVKETGISAESFRRHLKLEGIARGFATAYSNAEKAKLQLFNESFRAAGDIGRSIDKFTRELDELQDKARKTPNEFLGQLGRDTESIRRQVGQASSDFRLIGGLFTGGFRAPATIGELRVPPFDKSTTTWTDKLGRAANEFANKSGSYFEAFDRTAALLKGIGLGGDVPKTLQQVAKSGREINRAVNVAKGILSGDFLSAASVLTGSPFGSDGAAEARHQEVMGVLNLHTELLNQVLENQAVMKQQLNQIQEQLAALDRKLDAQHAEVMRILFYIRADIEVLRQKLDEILESEITRCVAIMDALERASSASGFRDEFALRREGFAAAVTIIDTWCMLGPITDRIRSLYHAPLNGERTEFLKCYRQAVTELMRTADTPDASPTAAWLLSPASTPDELTAKLAFSKAGGLPPFLKPSAGFDVPRTTLYDPANVVRITEIVRRFQRYEMLVNWGGSVATIRLSPDDFTQPMVLGSMHNRRNAHKLRLTFLLEQVQKCLAQEVLLSGDLTLPNLDRALHQPVAQALLSESNQWRFPELQANAALYFVTSRLTNQVLRLQYFDAWKLRSAPEMMTNLLGSLPLGYSVSPSTNAPVAGQTPGWELRNSGISLALPEPAQIWSPRFQLRPAVTRLAALQSELVKEIAFLELSTAKAKSIESIQLLGLIHQ